MDETPVSDSPAQAYAPATKWPSWWYWLIPLAVAVFGVLPKLWLHIAQPPAGAAYIGVPYLPADFLAYEAFIREAAHGDGFLLSNPFTTEVQSPRFILVFHWLLGQVVALTHGSPQAVLELCRVVLVFGFFGVWWWFLRPILPDARDRHWAAILVGFSGGFETWVQTLAPSLSQRSETASRFIQDTWTAYGWNFLSTTFNPLWLAGVSVALVCLGYLLAENPLHTWRQRIVVSGSFFLLYWIHPYSALGVLAIAGFRPCLEWMATRAINWRSVLRIAATLCVPLLAIAGLVLWQMQEPVYRASTGGFFGARDISIFWYPLTLGAVGWVALQGSLDWIRTYHPYRWAILGWIVVIAFLHSSPLLNGYHFVYFLPLPLCIVGASYTRQILTTAKSRWRAIALALALFGAPVFILLQSTKTAEENMTSVDTLHVVETLATLPDGNAFVPPPVGNLVPARSHHRVWVGHWFLTPNYYQREAEFQTLITEPARIPDLVGLFRRDQIRYAVIPTLQAAALEQRLGALIAESRPHGQWTLFILR